MEYGQSERDDAIPLMRGLQAAMFRLGMAMPAADPAPWVELTDFDGSGEQGIRQRKLGIRCGYELLRALRNGRLIAHFSDGRTSRDIPGWAWESVKSADQFAPLGNLPLDGLLPDDWDQWSGASVFVDREAFARWLDGVDWEDTSSRELPPAFDLNERPPNITFRALPETMFVTLSEAVSWIAFGISLPADRLGRALEFGSLPGNDAAAKLAEAMADLADIASAGAIEIRGKHAVHGTCSPTVDTIGSIALANYAQFDLLHDGLRFGRGIAWGSLHRAHNDAIADAPPDTYRAVKVNRQGLLGQFRRERPNGVPVIVAVGELSLPPADFDPNANATVAPWWSLLQAIAWIASGSKAYVKYVAELEGAATDDIGTAVAFSAIIVYIARTHCACSAKDIADDRRWENCTCTGDAGRALLEGIRVKSVTPIRQTPDGLAPLSFHELAGVGQRPSGIDWLEVRPAPVFSSAEILAAFPFASEKLAREANASAGAERDEGIAMPGGVRLDVALDKLHVELTSRQPIEGDERLVMEVSPEVGLDGVQSERPPYSPTDTTPARNLAGHRVDDGGQPRIWRRDELAKFAIEQVGQGSNQSQMLTAAQARWPDATSRPTVRAIREAYRTAMLSAQKQVMRGRPTKNSTK